MKKSFEFPEINISTDAVLSPILVNIYMYDFDLFIINEVSNILKILNDKRFIKKNNKKTNIFNERSSTLLNNYNDYNYLIKIFNFDNTKMKILSFIVPKFLNRLQISMQEYIINLIKEKSRLNRQIFVNFLTNKSKFIPKMFYIRYEDSFLLLINSSKNVLFYIQNKLKFFLKDYKGLNLTKDKILLTNIKINPVKFIGIKIYFYKSQKKLNVFIGIDYDKIMYEFQRKGYLNKKCKICSIGYLTKKQNVEIVNIFNEIIINYAIYYLPVITNEQHFNYLSYILEYSFYKTICHKNKTTIDKLKFKQSKNFELIKRNLIDNKVSKFYNILNRKNIYNLIGNIISNLKSRLYKNLIN